MIFDSISGGVRLGLVRGRRDRSSRVWGLSLDITLEILVAGFATDFVTFAELALFKRATQIIGDELYFLVYRSRFTLVHRIPPQVPMIGLICYRCIRNCTKLQSNQVFNADICSLTHLASASQGRVRGPFTETLGGKDVRLIYWPTAGNSKIDP